MQHCVFEFKGGPSGRNFALQKEAETKWRWAQKRPPEIQEAFDVFKTCVGFPSSYPAALQGKRAAQSANLPAAAIAGLSLAVPAAIKTTQKITGTGAVYL